MISRYAPWKRVGKRPPSRPWPRPCILTVHAWIHWIFNVQRVCICTTNLIKKGETLHISLYNYFVHWQCTVNRECICTMHNELTAAKECTTHIYCIWLSAVIMHSALSVHIQCDSLWRAVMRVVIPYVDCVGLFAETNFADQGFTVDYYHSTICSKCAEGISVALTHSH